MEQILIHNQVKSAKVAFMRPPLPQKHDNHMRWTLPAAKGVFIYIDIFFFLPNAVTIIDFNTNMIRELASYFLKNPPCWLKTTSTTAHVNTYKQTKMCIFVNYKKKKDSLWLFMLFMLIGIVFYCLSSLIKAEVKWY